MASTLVSVFRDVYKNDGNWLEITTDPTRLNEICYRLGDLLHGRGFDVIGALDKIGYSIAPVLAIIENLPFVLYNKGRVEPSVDVNDRVIFICGVVNETILELLDIFEDKITISAVVSLVDMGVEIKHPHVFLYKLDDLNK